MAKRMARGARRLLSPAARLARERVNILLPGLRPHPLPAALQTEPRAGARSAGGRFVLQVQARSPGSKTRSQTLGGFDFFFNFFFPSPLGPGPVLLPLYICASHVLNPRCGSAAVPRAAHPQRSGWGGHERGALRGVGRRVPRGDSALGCKKLFEVSCARPKAHSPFLPPGYCLTPKDVGSPVTQGFGLGGSAAPQPAPAPLPLRVSPTTLGLFLALPFYLLHQIRVRLENAAVFAL